MLLARNPQAPVVTVTWVLTEDSNDATTMGELQIDPGDLADAADLLRALFFNDA